MGEQRIPHHRKSLISSNEALYDGIKVWMKNSVRNWVSSRFVRKSGSTSYYRNRLMHDVELHARLTFGPNTDGFNLYSGAIGVFNSDENLALDMVQAIIELCEITDTYTYDEMTMPKTAIEELNRILIAGGSKWHVVAKGKKAKIEARVNETTTLSYSALIVSSEDYASLLKRSWEYCYGRQPNASEAYTYAIKAVEAVSWRTVTPNNSKATLGTIIKDLPVQWQSGKLANAFNDKSQNDTVETISAVMKRLWEGHTDRHATGDFIEPSQKEAESAVHMSILLCHLFKNGALVRK